MAYDVMLQFGSGTSEGERVKAVMKNILALSMIQTAHCGMNNTIRQSLPLAYGINNLVHSLVPLGDNENLKRWGLVGSLPVTEDISLKSTVGPQLFPLPLLPCLGHEMSSFILLCIFWHNVLPSKATRPTQRELI